MINRGNYESFFLEYLEGNLENKVINELMDFLKKNPDLKEELHFFEKVHLPEEQIVFSGKEYLYKSAMVKANELEINAIAFMEGILTDMEHESFETLMRGNPQLFKEYDLITKTCLVADRSIKFPDKQNLYRRSSTFILMKWGIRVAAVMIIFFGINSLFQNGTQVFMPVPNQGIASMEHNQIPPTDNIESNIKHKRDEISARPANFTEPIPLKSLYEAKNNHKDITSAVTTDSANAFIKRGLINLKEVSPVLPLLEIRLNKNLLAVSQSIYTKEIEKYVNTCLLDEPMIKTRAKGPINKDFLSTDWIIRSGLNAASELSRNRIGFKVKNGKISSLNFETKLMAFSIPINK